jgi:hypothetical protein
VRAFVSDQSTSFTSQPIAGPPGRTVVASLDLPPGSWVVFATVALAGNDAPGTAVNVQMYFEVGGQIYSGTIQCDFTISPAFSAAQVVPFNTGLVLDTPKTLQVVCVAQPAKAAVSQPTTITAIEVGSVTRITG